jgi:hypothetical protein
MSRVRVLWGVNQGLSLLQFVWKWRNRADRQLFESGFYVLIVKKNKNKDLYSRLIQSPSIYIIYITFFLYKIISIFSQQNCNLIFQIYFPNMSLNLVRRSLAKAKKV